MGVFSTFEAETPQVRLDVDRDKLQALGLDLSDMFAALQATLGGFYVNDFNLFGRIWTVYLQAEREYRKSINDIFEIQVRNDSGEMVPMSAFATTRSSYSSRRDC